MTEDAEYYALRDKYNLLTDKYNQLLKEISHVLTASLGNAVGLSAVSKLDSISRDALILKMFNDYKFLATDIVNRDYIEKEVNKKYGNKDNPEHI